MRIKVLFLIVLFFGFASSEISAQSGGAPAGGEARTISGGVVNGKATNLVKPAYPEAAKAVQASGAVNVQVTIDENGNVISASAVSGHPLLRAAAVAAARASKFSPTTLQGQPVKVTGVIVYNFVPSNPAAPANESNQMITLGFAMFLTVLKDLPGDEESDQILLDLGSEMEKTRTIGKAQFEKLVGAKSQSEKARLIDEIIGSFRRDLTGTDAWLVDLGVNWGAALGEAFKITGSEYRRERQNFVKNLQGMSWLLESPPKDVSAQNLNRIRAIAAYDNETDSITPAFIDGFFKTSLEFIDYLVKDGIK